MLNPRTGRWTQPDPHWSLANSIFGDEPRRINESTDSQGLHTYTMVPDVWAIIQSGNLYMYVMHNPVRFIDLDGLAAGCSTKRTLDTGGSGGGGKSPPGGTKLSSGFRANPQPATAQPIPRTQTTAAKAPQAPAQQKPMGPNRPDGRDVVTTNRGNQIDITPSANHTTVTANPGLRGTPNSSVDILNSQGQVVTRRWFGSDGKQIRDVDFTNHGNPRTHPEMPHSHDVPRR